jgi:hypothetical protein
VTADRGSPPGMPRWVKVSGILLAVLVLLLVVVLLISGGGHGPRRHVSGGSVRHALLPGVTAELALSRGALADHMRSEAHHRRP